MGNLIGRAGPTGFRKELWPGRLLHRTCYRTQYRLRPCSRQRRPPVSHQANRNVFCALEASDMHTHARPLYRSALIVVSGLRTTFSGRSDVSCLPIELQVVYRSLRLCDFAVLLGLYRSDIQSLFRANDRCTEYPCPAD